jgi:hypothetical protein
MVDGVLLNINFEIQKNMKKLIFLFLPLTLIALSGCDDGMEFENTPRGNFTALWTILDRNYCFFEYKDIDWRAMYYKYGARITPDITNDGLFNLMGEMLAELRDGHVNLIASHNITRYWRWHEDFPANFCPRIQRRYLGNNFGIAAGLRYTILEDNIGYIYYGSFSSGVGEGNLDQVLNRLAICKGIIFDVRSNGGGSLTNVDRIASRFFNERTRIGYISHKTGPGHNDFSQLFPKYIESSNRVRHQKPVIVLANRGSYSATNQFVNVMKHAPNAIIIGDRTGGGSGLPFSSELPNGWSVRFSASPMFNVNREHIEFGIEPHIRVDMCEEDMKNNIDTIIEKAREIIREMASGGDN